MIAADVHVLRECNSAAEPDRRPAVFLMTNTLETGGSERQFVTMANALDRNEFAVRLGCLKPFGPLLDEVDEITRFAAGGNLFGLQSLRSRLKLSKFLRRNHTAVTHSFDFYSNLMLIPAARYAGIPVVLGSHRQLGDLLSFRQFQAQSLAFRMCDRVVCNSRAAAGRLRAGGLAESKLTVIPNGIPDDFFAAALPAISREAGVLKIGMISRMNHAAKQHDMFLRVAARLCSRFPHLRLVLVGDGALRPGLQALAGALGIVDRVIFLGDRRDIPAVFASLDISVLPSCSESLSNVIMESMAAGVPVVAARIGGNPELVENGETGFLFDSGDEGKFSEALEALVTKPELRKKFGAYARAQAQARYAIPRVRDRYQELYHCLLKEKDWRYTPAPNGSKQIAARPENRLR